MESFLNIFVKLLRGQEGKDGHHLTPSVTSIRRVFVSAAT